MMNKQQNMKQILLGESRFLFVVQIVVLLVIISIVSLFVNISTNIQTIDNEGIIIFSIIIFCGSFLMWKKLFSLNLIIRMNGEIFIKNLIRRKQIQINEIHEIKISWLWLHGVLVLKNKKKYNFPLDGKHIREVLYMRNINQVINEYYLRIIQ